MNHYVCPAAFVCIDSECLGLQEKVFVYSKETLAQALKQERAKIAILMLENKEVFVLQNTQNELSYVYGDEKITVTLRYETKP